MAFSFWLAWKVTTRRALIGISSPVFGLRPGRCGLSRSWKLPKLDAFAALERSPDLLEERLDHVLGFALVQADLLEKEVCQLGLRQRHHHSPNPLYLRRLAENF
jgi:hypothetical protein